jgi:pilus assembly protein CpaC
MIANINLPLGPVVKNTLLALAAVATLAVALPANAEDASNFSSVSVQRGQVKSLQLGVGRSLIVDLPEDASEIFVGQPDVANAVVRSARRLYISTLNSGTTTIFALGADGRKIATLEISVGRDTGELVNLLKTAIPNTNISVRTAGGDIILTGSVDSAVDAQRAQDIAEGFLNSTTGKDNVTGNSATGLNANSKVINSLLIRGLDQVSLRVTISEIRRDVVKQLGVSYSGSSSNLGVGGFGSGLNSLSVANPLGVNGALGNSASIGWNIAGESLRATLNAFEQEGVARTLAEPTVTAVSGERAKFLAGGTIPIPSGSSCSLVGCVLSFTQQPYGVTLNFTPVVLAQGRIQMRVATEVTDIDYSKQVSVGGTSVPGFRTRKNETTVELPSGGSIVSAGLISTQSAASVSGLPGLMNLPVLGALFRSHDYQRQETELLIAVTPYIVHSVDPKDVARVDQNLTDASDPQGWFLGRINRIYSTSQGLRPPPTYSGKVGFITD